ncbi:origin recognition complex subunit 2 domain-containing protein [Sarocladium implicatum]|nr:origin recognition complex subunit 2 domain-containing protein [Sarocladium implicatum]
MANVYDFDDGGDIHMTGGDAQTEDTNDAPQVTPRKRGRPPKSDGTPTPRKAGTGGLQTPKKATNGVGFTPLKQAADRSARRKSVKAMIQRTVGDGSSDEDEEEDHLAREIYGSSEDEEQEGDASEKATTNGNRTEEDETSAISGTEQPETPSKASGRKPRRKRAKSPTPPRDLPPQELYFLHNKPGRPKTSDNTLESLSLLSHEEYFAMLRNQEDHHKSDIEYLESLHVESFPQWSFELRQGFSICLYGFGSKRMLMTKFAKHIYSTAADHAEHQIIIINGYAPTTTVKEILNTIKSALDPTQRIPQSQPAVMAQNLLSHLSSGSRQLTLIVNSIDAPAIRKPSTQAIFAQLAAHPQIQLICSVDTPDFPLMWDIGVRSAFNFVFHDSTTFAPFKIELDIIDEVHELLGRKARRVNGREGVAFVLRSLPENARNLFQLIVGEILIAMEDDDMAAEEVGVEYKMVYTKAEEEFICSSEMAFRTLLKEFHDHQIITSRKDAFGTELLRWRGEDSDATLRGDPGLRCDNVPNLPGSMLA